MNEAEHGVHGRHRALVGGALAIVLASASPHLALGSTTSPLDTVVHSGLLVSVGWALGSTSSPFDPANNAPSNEQFDAEPLIHLNGFLGTANTVSADTKLILGNFGRLVNSERTGIAEFSADSSGTSVRRAIIADFTVRSPFLTLWPNCGGVALAVNSGFIFDAQADADSQEVLDAASYIFAGISLAGRLTDESYLQADLLLGASELLTGREAFDWHDQHLRFRPRVKFHIGDAPINDLDIGFWGDLGWDREEADAFTVFVAKAILRAPKSP